MKDRLFASFLAFREKASFWREHIRMRVDRSPSWTRIGLIIATVGLGISSGAEVVHAQAAAAVVGAAASAIPGGTVFAGLVSAIPSVGSLITNGPASIAVGIVSVILNTLLYVVIQLLLKLNTGLTYILVHAAAYNYFVNAGVVVTGWTLVRDICNMFFIVVLLIIAFSTIIGYQEFHYKRYLPKLLLMAVLINFSRTLIGLLIDFSQVITLTFVNGFQNAAFGNFASAFQLTNLLNTSKDVSQAIATGNYQGAASDLGSTMITMLYAISVLTIAATTITILALYFIVRIIFLWILLILSPIAFLMTALPGKMQKAVAPASQDFWNKLSAWLTGGPIVAFFLWLALATVQKGTNDFATIVPDSPEANITANAAFSEASTPTNMSLFIVSVAFMLIGVNTAVSVSQKAAPQLGGIAARIKSEGGPAGYVGRRAARVTGRAARAGGRASLALARPYVGQAAGQLGSRVQSAAPGLARIPGIGAPLARGAARLGGRGIGFERGLQAEAAKGLGKETEFMPPETALAYMQSLKQRNLPPDQAHAVDRKMAEMATKGGQKAYIDQAKAGLQGRGLSGDQLNAVADAQAEDRMRSIIAADSSNAKASNDSKRSGEIDEAYKKDPSKYNDIKDILKSVNENPDSTRKHDAYKDMAVVAAELNKRGFADAESGLTKPANEILEDDDFKKMLTGARGEYIRAAMTDFGTAEGNGRLRQILAAGTEAGSKDAGTVSAANAQRYRMSKSADGKQMVFANAAGQFGGFDMKEVKAGSQRVRSVPQLVGQVSDGALRGRAERASHSLGVDTPSRIRSFQQPLNERQANAMVNVAQAYSNPPATTNAAAMSDFAHAQGEALASGLPTSVAANYDDATNTYRDDQSRSAHLENLDSAMANVDSDDPDIQSASISMVANTNADLLKNGGQMRDVVVDALNRNADKVRKLFSNATKEQGKKMQSMMKELSKQAEAVVDRGGPTNTGEEHLVELRTKLGGKAMRNLGGDSNKKA